MGMQVTAPIDEQLAEEVACFSFMRAFNCSPEEYDRLGFKRSQKLLAINRVYHEAEQAVQERVQAQQAPPQHPMNMR